MDRRKWNQLIEHIINEDAENARALFHDIVVETSRQLYEEMMSEEPELDVDGDIAGDLADEIEDEESGEFDGDESLESDEEGDEEEDEEEEGFELAAEEDEGVEERLDQIEDRLDDAESADEDIMAKLDRLLSGEEDMEGEDMEGAEGEMPAMPADQDLAEAPPQGEETAEPVMETSAKMERAPKPVNTSTASASPVRHAKPFAQTGAKPNRLGGSHESGRPAPKVQGVGETFANKPGASVRMTPVKGKAASGNHKTGSKSPVARTSK